ncbi:hypothetical protein DY000_02007236 [Brassica cretica]|uniref:Uncharacterized protein n=1 Tax=Brassica cretica TaxID=69181 RepID=A0ABQ7CIT5_BRACR|nr:hypothetical protein DY000_02007236 [Brassica cretica]
MEKPAARQIRPEKSWADSGFHESFAVETVIHSSNEDPIEEYDEDYGKERAIEIAMQDERYSSHSFNNTSPPSIDRVYSASVDTHTHPAKRSYASIPPQGPRWPCKSYGWDALTSLDKAPSPSIDTRYECGRCSYDIYGARKFRREQKDEYGVYRDESGYARSVAGEMIPVTKDNIRKILERASLFEESHICLPEHATSFTPTKLAPEIYTKDEINEMVTGICGAQEKLGDELKTLKDEYGVYRDESGYARSVAGEMIPVTKDNIRKILERASLFEESHICLPEHATSFTPTKLAPEIYTKDEINEMVTGICGAQEKLGDELKTF